MDEQDDIDSAWAHAEECEMRRHEEIARGYRQWLIDIGILRTNQRNEDNALSSETNRRL